MCHMSGQLKDSIVKCMVWVCVRCGGKGGEATTRAVGSL